MTHNYLYIKAGRQLDAGSRFYQVAVGESEAQTKKRAWLKAYAKENGHLFVRWSLEAVGFLGQCLKSISKDMLCVEVVSAAELVEILRDGHAEHNSSQVNMNKHKLMMQIDARYHYEHTILRKR